MWQRTKHGSKSGFDKLWGWADKLGAPVNRLSNKLGSEAFWPTTLDKESDKAARILRSFCKDGFYEEETLHTLSGPQQKQKVLKKIPAEVIRNAVGLAVFTTMRSGLWVSGAGGSGILVGRTEDGSWSPPSGIMLHTAGLGFLVGVDIYDCVVVINTEKALEAFSKVRCTVGGEVSAVAGPVGVGGIVETEVHKRQAPIFTYMKSRGFYAGVQIDGTVIIERTDENERFYGEQVGVADILAGKVRRRPPEIRALMETIKAAQGDTDINESLLPSEPPPADYELETDGRLFGVPDKMDPDPYGVLALEKEGLHIVESGTRKRPTSEAFEFNPAPSSPIYSTFSRKSVDSRSIRDSKSVSRRSSWRTSTLSTATTTTSAATQTCDIGIQTDFDALSTSSRRASESQNRSPMAEIPENEVAPTPPTPKSRASSRAPSTKETKEEDEKDEMMDEVPELTEEIQVKLVEEPEATQTEKPEAKTEETSEEKLEEAVEKKDGEKSETAEDPKDEQAETRASTSRNFPRFSTYGDGGVNIEEPIVTQVRQAAAPKAIRARLVTVTKPSPPRIPPRNPIRNRRGPLVINAEPYRAGSSRDSMSPRSPPSSSEHPSISTMDSASPVSSRDSFSSDEHIDAMNKRISIIGTVSRNAEDGRSEKELSRKSSDEFHSIPPTPGEQARSPIEEDFS